MAALHLIQGKRYLFQRGDRCAVTYFRATYVSLYGGTGWSTMVCRDMESNQNRWNRRFPLRPPPALRVLKFLTIFHNKNSL